MNPPSRYKTRPGISLVIAMMMVMAFMIMMASVMEAMQRSFQIAKGGRAADQARRNAEEGLELGLYKENHTEKEFTDLMAVVDKDYLANVGKVKLAGGTVTFKVSDDIEGGGEVCRDKTITTETFSETGDINKCGKDDHYFVYPFPGTGTHGGSACDTKKQPHIFNEQWYRDAYFYLTGTKYEGGEMMSGMQNLSEPVGKKKTDYSPADVMWYIKQTTSGKGLEPLDHPCLWNRLVPGVAAEVPLYNRDVGMEALKEFTVRVRTPCKEGMLCNTKPAGNKNNPGTERMDVFTNNAKEKNDLAMVWDITGTCTKNGEKESDVCFVSGFDLKTLDEKVKNNTIKKTDAEDDFQPRLSAIIKQLLQNDSKNIYYSASSLQNIMLGLKNKKNGNEGDPIYVVGSKGNNNISTLIEFFEKNGPWKDVDVVKKPLFHLSLASALEGIVKDSKIPFVEYQILYKRTSGNKPIITNPVVISSGKSGGYTINMETSVTNQTGTFGYALVGK